MARTTDATRKQPEQTATPAEHACIFIKLGEVKLLTTFSTSEIYRRIAAGTFPAQVMLGPKSAVWIKTEILDWCEARIAESREVA
ncbi:Prophage CP4-57 regulatory protein (AlpA) [compost metagenome]